MEELQKKKEVFFVRPKFTLWHLSIKGKGKMYVGDEIYEVSEGDCVDVPAGTKFAAEGYNFEYITAESPAWYPEQATILDKNGNIIED